MSFETALAKIEKNVIDLFEKAANAAVKGQTDAEQVFRDFEKACEDTGFTSREAIREELKKSFTKRWMNAGMSKAEAEAQFEGNWEEVIDLGDKIKEAIDLRDKVINSAPKVEAAAKSGWLKFVGTVTAIFAGAMAYIYIQTPSGLPPDQEAALRYMEQTLGQVDRLNHLSQMVIRENEFSTMLHGLEGLSAPTPLESLPPLIAVVAVAPVQVQVTTPKETRTFETTFGEVYANVPPQVQEYMTNNPPETHSIEVDDAMRERFRQSGGNDHHKTFTVDGTPFGSATFSY
jgi:hypothetical protein